jgi:multiple sugar transport system substrate-binding protein
VIAVPGNAPEKVIRFDKAFQEQKTVAMRATTNMIKELQSAADKGSPVNWDMVTYPKVDAKQNHFGVAGARAIMITPNSKVKEQAFKVIETLLSNEVQVTQNKLGVMTPLASQDVQKTFGTGIEFLKGKNLQAAYKLKPGFRVITRYDNIAGNTAFDNSLKLYTGADVNTVIRQANEELNKKIAEEKAKKK